MGGSLRSNSTRDFHIYTHLPFRSRTTFPWFFNVSSYVLNVIFQTHVRKPLINTIYEIYIDSQHITTKEGNSTVSKLNHKTKIILAQTYIYAPINIANYWIVILWTPKKFKKKDKRLRLINDNMKVSVYILISKSNQHFSFLLNHLWPIIVHI